MFGEINICILFLRAYVLRGFDMVFNTGRFVGAFLSCALLLLLAFV